MRSFFVSQAVLAPGGCGGFIANASRRAGEQQSPRQGPMGCMVVHLVAKRP